MKPEIKAKWIEALRSGKYKQGTGVLRGKDLSGKTRHCCLGVLCEILPPIPGVDVEDRLMNRGLPGLEVQTFCQIKDGEFDKLAHMNDTKRLTFSQIADYIEEHL